MKFRWLEIAVSVFLFVASLLLWDMAIRLFKVPAYLVPSPLSVGAALIDGLVNGTFYPHIAATLYAVVAGYLVGCFLAVVIGALLAEVPLLEGALMPYIVALQSMPKVALAPLIIVWFGFGMSSKVVLVALICFFPVFINTLVGVRSVNPDIVNLYRAFRASRWNILLNVKLPAAASSIFAGLQISVAMALIGAVVGEFIASKAGLGNLLQASSMTMDVATMFAVVIVLAAIGVIGNEILQYLHRRVVFWESRTHAVAESA
ncbi:ABC transporter permease [Bradyrhizobium sp. KBS0727]|uniref:ABC transporter permease n=1 Tax=unclassified Bradyrhizobium TaxID=2631580 RepID=UPI00110F45CE|nr:MULTISPECIES: ABC transporter permease [unclassified Bradyrhizobium]QDW39898.1 ABC transporter permease [Bradyrhizobium sp. KBS0725]QDW46501.1 ABC transporter permease [Bradyrhizobium sp. KBS0727]